MTLTLLFTISISFHFLQIFLQIFTTQESCNWTINHQPISKNGSYSPLNRNNPLLVLLHIKGEAKQACLGWTQHGSLVWLYSRRSCCCLHAPDCLIRSYFIKTLVRQLTCPLGSSYSMHHGWVWVWTGYWEFFLGKRWFWVMGRIIWASYQIEESSS